NLMYLSGRAISLLVPRYIHDDCEQLYKLCLTDDIVVVDINNNKLNSTVILSKDKTKYYLTIPITQDTFYDCDIVLQFIELTINLEKINICDYDIQSCSDVVNKCCNDNHNQYCNSNQYNGQ